MNKISEKIEYYVTPKDGERVCEWWKCRYYKRISAPKWEKLKETDNISEILKTHKYSFKFYPDNDDFNMTIEFEVDIKKIITKTEII